MAVSEPCCAIGGRRVEKERMTGTVVNLRFLGEETSATKDLWFVVQK